MGISTGIAIYFLIWWVVLFAVLPWGVRAQGEEAVPGSDPGAPRVPRIWMKLVWTTLASAVVFARVLAVLAAVGPAHFRTMSPPLGIMLALMGALACGTWWRSRRESAAAPPAARCVRATSLISTMVASRARSRRRCA